MPSARADILSDMEATCYSQDQVDALANFKLNCDRVRLDNKSLKKAYDECRDNKCNIQWYQEPKVIVLQSITVAVIAFLLGRGDR